uniref:4-hydroxy-3-methylbut-2-enyl diphosphate reductase n=1 Tax=Alexandrium catenella TaxID=2925 RepID=A0A7S1MH83_ALECA|eukprot:CAMPEP_0171190502 /NCGR_PEP_ID=MMETSP0790-20130122/18888_1 /TAXON_ID=2925 /ORGANISM="Alexandrium catenella, Strain OF101" /LENGTH=456 /DNA_ID=CAMNT_0011655633 /DNA_START=71 /DNA_END=1441 /DNA_ORIENTATION=-
MKSDQYYKFGKTQMDKAMKELMSISGSELVSEMRKNGFRLTIGDVTFVLAQSYGFCWGVERAVAMAYEARNFFPDKSIWVTNEIIHNPLVNENLTQMGFQFVKTLPEGGKDFSGISEGDVVVLPAFGASIDEMAFLKQKKATIVDTTCPWVAKVWTSVEKSKDKGHTSIIHGKYDHEETIATKSFAKKFIVVKNMPEAEYVANYIIGGGDREEFLKKFEKAIPEGFDPDDDLDRVGVANQTTMLKGETELIGKLFERTMIKKFGPQEVNEHFISFNTICDATQERQDAMYQMLGTEYEAPSSKLYADLEGEQVGVELRSTKQQEKLSSKAKENEMRGAASETSEAPKRIDLCLVVGGYNSSNTTHLIEIVEEEGVPGYHIDAALRIGGADGELTNRIQYKPVATPPGQAMLEQGLETKEGFLPDGPIVIGLTSGASTPDNILGECCKRILEIKGAA